MTDNLRNVVNIEENEGPPLSFHGQVQAQKGDGPLRMHRIMRDSYHPESNPHVGIRLLAHRQAFYLLSLLHTGRCQHRKYFLSWLSFVILKP